ncbi:D-2-hydroxyacid dehydrogenase [Oscillibacter sp.]|uniref:D-2-hydroxyacid dehydrogenase n=1 Tax=Oscillibacter sp. TaxID=1945593 RepID=UPI002607880D|nr:D-2-hydroxyacid dehydrogenase [Oscillibacter sp.]MDD3346706.1 D-2-hydroxyacid dehydrogenase [Oscillibacter sp.]
MSREICVFQDFLTDALRAKIDTAAADAGFAVHYFTSDRFEEAKACLPHCEVLYAQSPELLRAAPANLKWYCASSAGVDVYCKNDGIFANPDCLLSNSNAYGVTIAEYVVMVTLMLLRRMPEYTEPLRNHEWAPPRAIRSIRDSEITVLGTGNIGSNVAQRMRGMGAARIVGLSRSGKAREAVYDELYPTSELDKVLPNTHILVMALPSTAETFGILSRERIALLPQDAIVINVGRGTAVDQSALVDALNAGQIAGAGLDVMVPEPLPKDDPLWNAKNLVLTPHTSGNLTLGYTCEANVDMFCADLGNYAAGRPLTHLVDRSRGY